MAVFKRFKAMRPSNKYLGELIAQPYDTMNRKEAFEVAKNNKRSFLHISRSEVDFDFSVDQYSKEVYEKAKENIDIFYNKSYFHIDYEDSIYLYKQTYKNKVQVGFVGLTAVSDYENNVIKKHENTLPKKELDRINHFYTCEAYTSPVFLTYTKNEELEEIINKTLKTKPLYNVVTEDKVKHEVFKIIDEQCMSRIEDLFASVDSLYIADGHHRAASAYQVSMKYKEEGIDVPYFLSVVFPSNHLHIMDYNRVVYDLNNYTYLEFMNKISKYYDIEEIELATKPSKKGQITMYLDKKWYLLEYKNNQNYKSRKESLDAYILEQKVLNDILDIKDVKTSSRIDFVGGIRGISGVIDKLGNNKGVCFMLYPVTIEDIMEVSNESELMPAKSTWFEPKLRSGLFVYQYKK